MNKEEKEYYLNIINIQNGLLEAYAQKNTNKMIFLQKELERQQKSKYQDFITEKALERKEKLKRVDNLLTEIKAVVKDL